MPTRPSTHQKAVQLNLDPTKYGTFAEIGAGQEVARWFFRAGHAAGTVAKSISAYDMAVSDAIYGRCDRYVSRMRLEAMLAYEFDLLLQRLDATRGDTATFFVFADTVATRSRTRDSGDGWMGIRLQTHPRAQPSEILIHVAMPEADNVREQEALGIIGVNLIYGAFYLHVEPTTLITSLMDDLRRDRIEIDVIKFSGPGFANVDNRLMSLQLVEQELTDAAMFTAAGEVVQPSEVLYKKPILVERGRFRPITNLTMDLLLCAHRQFLQEPELGNEPPVVLMEMTLRSLGGEAGVDHSDFLARVDILGTLGQTVLISTYVRYFRLVEYLCRYTEKPIVLALGVPSLLELTDDKYYGDLKGGTLESVGRMFKRNVKLYVYPYRDPASGTLITGDTLPVAAQARHLYAYLLEHRYVQSIRASDTSLLDIHSAAVLAQIQAGDAAWERFVPTPIVETIKRDRLFGWRPAP